MQAASQQTSGVEIDAATVASTEPKHGLYACVDTCDVMTTTTTTMTMMRRCMLIKKKDTCDDASRARAGTYVLIECCASASFGGSVALSSRSEKGDHIEMIDTCRDKCWCGETNAACASDC